MAKAANWRPPQPSAGVLVWTAVFFALVFAGIIAFDYGIGDPPPVINLCHNARRLGPGGRCA